MKKRCDYFVLNPNFAYSLYHYLAFKRVIGEKFTPVRYRGQDKYDFIMNAKMENKNLPEEWFLGNHGELFIELKRKNKKVDMVCKVSDANESYDDFYKRSNNKSAVKSINGFMAGLGFKNETTRISNEGLRIYSMDLQKYNELIDAMNQKSKDEELNSDDEFDEEEIAKLFGGGVRSQDAF
jgi:hypothetical protein